MSSVQTANANAVLVGRLDNLEQRIANRLGATEPVDLDDGEHLVFLDPRFERDTELAALEGDANLMRVPGVANHRADQAEVPLDHQRRRPGDKLPAGRV